VKRLGALSLIKKSVRARRESGRQRSGAPPLVEDAIEAVEAQLRGRPDRVFWSDGVAHIIDLKTCASESEIRPEHRRQLLAYAYLFHERHKVWPATATIQYVNGERQSFPVSPAEAKEVAQAMVRTLETVSTSTDDVLDLATPSVDACRWCSFKAACSPFFAAVDESWELHERDVLGTVQGIEAAERRSSVTIDVILGNAGESRVVALADSPTIFSNVVVGDKVAIVGAKPTRSPTTVHCPWDSIVCVWPG
jgi:CRISPR/Cas system-associated exonuclease Cas4 (RecB family)